MRLDHLVLQRCAVRRGAWRGAVLLVVAGLVACGAGGGDGGDEDGVSAPPPPQPAEQASSSVAAWLAYVGQRIREDTAESIEARNIDALRPPVSDTGEPAVI